MGHKYDGNVAQLYPQKAPYKCTNATEISLEYKKPRAQGFRCKYDRSVESLLRVFDEKRMCQHYDRNVLKVL